jgi:hypothetical protein
MMSTLPPESNSSFLSRFRRNTLPPTRKDNIPLSSDRRRFTRQACRSLYALCQEPQSQVNELRAGQVSDMSADGIGLVLSRPYPPGAELEVELQDQAGWVKETVRVRVVHASPKPTDHWLVGCSLIGSAI